MKRRPFERAIEPFDSNQFSYDKSDKTLIAEASDLNDRHLQQIYNDACDVGLAIRSAKTGKIVTYHMTNEHKDNEGDIQFWDYEPTTESIRRVPECLGSKLKVFND
jgi:hypothetical protein